MNKKRILAGLISCTFILSSCVKYDKSWETVPTTERAPLPELDPPEDPESDPYAEGLVSAFFSGLLGREPTEEELGNNALLISTGSKTPRQLVLEITEGEEFAGRNLSDTGFVECLCISLLGEEPADAVTDFWVNGMEDGTSRETVIRSFLEYEEFNDLCEAFGYPAGESDTEEEDTQDIDTEEIKDLLLSISEEEDEGDEELHLTSIGGFAPSITAICGISDAVAELSEQNIDVGFLLIDLETGYGLYYNPWQTFYTASSIKGPYAASFCCLNRDSAEGWENTIKNMLINSDNDAYTSLNDTYGRTYIKEWCEMAGIDPAPCNYKYPYFGARDMSLLWLLNYEFFTEDEYGQEVRTWFQTPVYSLINGELGELYVTESKAGWMTDEEPRHKTTCDSGIVYADNGTYIISIVSDSPSTIDPLRPLMQALNAAHDEM